MSLITGNKVKKNHTSQDIVKKKRTKLSQQKNFEKFKLCEIGGKNPGIMHGLHSW